MGSEGFLVGEVRLLIKLRLDLVDLFLRENPDGRDGDTCATSLPTISWVSIEIRFVRGSTILCCGIPD